MCFKMTMKTDAAFNQLFLYLDPCTLQPCQNGGLCFYNGTHDSYCVCPDKFIGDRCEKGMLHLLL